MSASRLCVAPHWAEPMMADGPWDFPFAPHPTCPRKESETYRLKISTGCREAKGPVALRCLTIDVLVDDSTVRIFQG